MPPKQKESAATPAASGPKPKRSRTSFQTPTTPAATSAASEVVSTSTATPPASGPKPKRSKTSFQTPTTPALECATSVANEVGSPSTSYSTNRVVTLQPSAGGRRGYCTQDLSTTENSAIPSDIIGDSDIPDISDTIPPLVPESDIQPSSGAKSRPKQKNTTTVGYIQVFAKTGIFLMLI